ncbi:hypothetical protein ACFWNE_10520 [Streptomyces goshikiensis]|uniref:hypothetical protein n=1 Tax=Streptomyces TaxID=1883 RepID=UPI001AE2BF26|nr:hypothetical protein [Streptomyces sp. KCTC 0041BP]MBP0932439.1 hypothetical protein [Streptomyces sp. KCTC 0041BP]
MELHVIERSDFTQAVIGRHWMIQSFLPGTPAPELLGSYPKETHGAFFRQMGEITAAVHAVAGPWFGPVTGPGHARWSEAVLTSLRLIAEDVESCGLDAADLRKSADAAQAGAQGHSTRQVGCGRDGSAARGRLPAVLSPQIRRARGR